MLLTNRLTKALDCLNSSLNANVGKDHTLFQLIVEIVVDLRAGKKIDKSVAGFGKTRFNFVKKTHTDFLIFSKFFLLLPHPP